VAFTPINSLVKGCSINLDTEITKLCHFSFDRFRIFLTPRQSIYLPTLPRSSFAHLLSPYRFNAARSSKRSLSSNTFHTQYKWIPDVENLEAYSPGGFYPVNIGDKFRNRYRIVDKLGFGGYSTVWLARDLETSSYVALKVGIAEQAGPVREIKTLQAIHSSDLWFPLLGRT
jgi:hypothetical protein